MKLAARISVLAAVWCWSSHAPAVTLSLDDFVAAPQDRVVMPIAFSVIGEEQVSVIQFDLLFDTGALTAADVRVGPASESAAKDINVTEQPDGSVRVILYGFNQNAIPDGVIALSLIHI